MIGKVDGKRWNEEELALIYLSTVLANEIEVSLSFQPRQGVWG